jgi:hypothetical protein
MIHIMYPIIAMAGLAEAAALYGLLIVAAALLLVGGLLALAWRKHWPVVAGMACGLCLLIVLLFQPWSAFHSPQFPDDPDEIYWLIRYRIAAVVWGLMLLIGLTGWGLIVRRRRLFANAHKGV